MLPFLGHSVVVLTNENQSPARFALMLTILDAMLGLEAPVPSWTDAYVAKVVANRQAEISAIDSLRARIQQTPPAGQTPRFNLSAYTGSFSHVAYGTANISLVDGGKGLQLCGAATLSSRGDIPWAPQCAPLFHMFFLGPQHSRRFTLPRSRSPSTLTARAP